MSETVDSGARSRVKTARHVTDGGGGIRIGELAAQVGVSVDAVRFYERRGVLHPAPRTPGGYRVFGQRDVDRVRLARQLQKLGLTLGEVVEAMAAHDLEGATCVSQRWRLEQVQARVEAQLAELRRTRLLVREAVAACDEGRCRLSAPGAPSGS